jgi:hypothetical protein
MFPSNVKKAQRVLLKIFQHKKFNRLIIIDKSIFVSIIKKNLY